MFKFVTDWIKSLTRAPKKKGMPARLFETSGVFKGYGDEKDIEYVILSGEDHQKLKLAFLEAKLIEENEPTIFFGAEALVGGKPVSVYVPASAYIMNKAGKKAILDLVERQMREQFSKVQENSSPWTVPE